MFGQFVSEFQIPITNSLPTNIVTWWISPTANLIFINSLKNIFLLSK
jgi:isochorismate hydrolase